MDSSGDTKGKTKDFHLVYQRRRKATSSGKTVSDTNENMSLHSGSSMAKTDGSHQIGDDGSFSVCKLCNDGVALLRCEACPGTYHLVECLDRKSVPKGDWRCPKCFNNDELSMPIKYLKNLDIKKDFSSKKGKDGSFSSGSKSKKQSN